MCNMQQNWMKMCNVESYSELLLSAKSFNKKKERADSIIVESAQIVTFVFATKLQ